MNATEPIGYLASTLVLATFCMRHMLALRVVAIASNLAFIGYAALTGLHPVLLLHALLLPINLWRLWQCAVWRTRTGRLRARFAPDLERRSR